MPPSPSLNEAAREASPSRKVPVDLNGQPQKEVDKKKSNRRLMEANKSLLETKRKFKFGLHSSAEAQRNCASSESPRKFSPSSSRSIASPLKSPPKQRGRPIYWREDAGLVATVARTQRKVFSTGYFAKKLKRFQKDSPSASNRRVFPGISVVDLCSSDEDDDGDTIGNVPKDPARRKDPPLKNENNGSTNKAPTNKVPIMVGADVGTTRSENLQRKASPEVNLCSSSSDDDDDDDDCSFKPSDQVSQKFLVMGVKVTKEALEKGDTNRSPTGKAYKKLQNHTMPQSMASWKVFSKDLAKRKSEILDLKKIVGATKRTAAAATGMETTIHASSFGFPSVSSHSFSTDRKRKLLTLLVPKSLSLETIEAENWEVADYLSVSKGFAERFGNLDIKDLERLARGESLVPEGMVSTEFTSAEKAAKLFHSKIATEAITAKKYIVKSHEEKDGTEEASVPIIGVNISADMASNRASEGQSEANSAFRWNGAFKLLPKDRPDGFNTNSVLVGSRNKESDVHQNDLIDSKFSPTNNLNIVNEDTLDGVERDFDVKEDHDRPSISCNESQPTGNEAGSTESGAPDDSKGAVDEIEDQKEADISVGKNEEEDDATEESKAKSHDDYEGSAEKVEDTKEADVSVGKDEQEGDGAEKTKAQDNEGDAGKTESPKEVDKTVAKDEKVGNRIDETNPEVQDDDDFDAFKTESPKEVDEAVEKTIVKYEGEELSTQKALGYLATVGEARGLVGEVMANIVDKVNSRCSQENDQHPREIKTDIMNDSVTNHEELMVGLSPEVDLSAISQDEDKKEREDRPMIVISTKQLVLLALPLLCTAGIFRRLGLFDVSNSILEGCFRALLQLHILGSLLSPIFKYGAKYPGLVGCYALFMIVLASYEASSRTKYTHENHFTIIVQSLVLNVSWVAMWAFGTILKPRPIWNPRYLLPIVGMLLGNSINGISITLDTITTSLVEKQSEVDLYLSFGADQYEAVSGIIAHSIHKGTTPSLNMMCVVGIVSIPGMMTGQILGGSSPMVAARYQVMIIFLIALSTLSTIMFSSCFTVMSAFCSHQILRPDRFVKNHKRGLARLILWVWGYVFGSGSDLVPVGLNGMPDGSGGGLVTEEELNANLRSSVTGFEIRPLKKGLVVSDGEGRNALIQASGLNRYFEGKSDVKSDTDRRRVLFQDLSFSVSEGDLLLVSGPSGTGKTQLLRMVAGLNPLQDGEMWLQGRSWEDYNGNHAVKWRKQIRYVTQTKVQVPGTPLQFIKKILSFRSWKAVDDRNDAVIEHDFMKHVSHHIRQWGMGLESLNKEWSVLSGGESQRVLMAIALASRPKILLFDESTSALDYKSKLAVETSIKDFVADHEGGVLWVSHDEQQVERMMDHLESDGANID